MVNAVAKRTISYRWLKRCSVVLIAALTCATSYGQADFRDPTQPMDGGSISHNNAKAEPLKLNSILISAERKVAVINGLPVQINERVAGAKVIKILDDRVVVVYEGKEQTLLLRKQIKQLSEG